MSRTSNIANLQFKWLQEFLDINFPDAGIIEVGITGPSTYLFTRNSTDLFPQLSHWLAHPSGVAIWCEKVSALEGMWWEVHLWVTINLAPVCVLILFWFPLDFLDARNTHLCLERLQTSGYVLSPYLISQDPASTPNVSSTRVAAADTILPPDGWQCDPWFKTQVKPVAEEFSV